MSQFTKPLVLLVALTVLVSVPAGAQDRTTVESDMVTHTKAATIAVTQANAALAAGNKKKSCLGLRTAAAELEIAELLAAQDQYLIDDDKRIDDVTRAAQKQALSEQIAKMAGTHDHLNALISENC